MSLLEKIKGLKIRLGALKCTAEDAKSVFTKIKENNGQSKYFLEKISSGSMSQLMNENSIGCYNNYKSWLVYHEGWTIFFQNFVTGTDRTFIANFSFAGGISCVLTDCRYGDKILDKDKEFLFEYYEGKLLPKRTLNLSKQTGNWKFYQKGEPFDFEDQNRYNISKIQTRLDQIYIKFLLEKIGIQIDTISEDNEFIEIETLRISNLH